MRGRVRKLCFLCSGLLLAGCAYALVCSKIGVGLPCVFHLITGLQCPGCGVTRMCLSLLRGDFAAAWQYNAAILCLFPLGAVVAANVAVRYVRIGTLRPSRWANALLWCMIAVLLVFGVVRNLPLHGGL